MPLKPYDAKTHRRLFAAMEEMPPDSEKQPAAPAHAEGSNGKARPVDAVAQEPPAPAAKWWLLPAVGGAGILSGIGLGILILRGRPQKR